MKTALLLFLVTTTGFWLHADSVTITNADIAGGSNEVDRLIPALKNYYALQQFDKAEKLCLHILELNPADSKIQEYLGIIYITERNYAKAIPILQKAWDLGNTNALHWIFIDDRQMLNWQAITVLIPTMLENKSTDPFLVDDLVAYALQQVPPDKQLFSEAVQGVSNDQIIQVHRSKIQLFATAFQSFGDNDRAQKLILESSEIRKNEEDKKADAAMLLNQGECRSILDKYEQNPLAWRGDDLLTVAIAYFKDSQFEKSKAVYERFSEFERIADSNPNDIHVFTGLGNCYLCQTNFEEAILQYRKAWDMGDSNVVQTLAAAYIGSTNHSVERMRDLIPCLMNNKRENLVFILGFASNVTPPDRELFMKAVEGLTDSELLENASVTKLSIAGFEQFGQKDRAEALRAKWQKQH